MGGENHAQFLNPILTSLVFNQTGARIVSVIEAMRNPWNRSWPVLFFLTHLSIYFVYQAFSIVQYGQQHFYLLMGLLFFMLLCWYFLHTFRHNLFYTSLLLLQRRLNHLLWDNGLFPLPDMWFCKEYLHGKIWTSNLMNGSQCYPLAQRLWCIKAGILPLAWHNSLDNDA